MEFTLGGAAKAAGVSKATIHRAVKSGKLSAHRLDDGSYKIDASELARVYPLTPETVAETIPETVARDDAEPAVATPETPRDEGSAILVGLRTRLEMAEALRAKEAEERARERAQAEDTIADLRRRLDDAQAQVRGLLPAPTAATPASTPRRSFLARLLGA